MFCAITFLHIILVSGWPLDVKIAPQMLVSLWGCLGNRSWCSRTWAGPTVSRFTFPSIPCCLLFLSRRKTLLGERRFFCLKLHSSLWPPAFCSFCRPTRAMGFRNFCQSELLRLAKSALHHLPRPALSSFLSRLCVEFIISLFCSYWGDLKVLMKNKQKWCNALIDALRHHEDEE